MMEAALTKLFYFILKIYIYISIVKNGELIYMIGEEKENKRGYLQFKSLLLLAGNTYVYIYCVCVLDHWIIRNGT